MKKNALVKMFMVVISASMFLTGCGVQETDEKVEDSQVSEEEFETFVQQNSSDIAIVIESSEVTLENMYEDGWFNDIRSANIDMFLKNKDEFYEWCRENKVGWNCEPISAMDILAEGLVKMGRADEYREYQNVEDFASAYYAVIDDIKAFEEYEKSKEQEAIEKEKEQKETLEKTKQEEAKKYNVYTFVGYS